MTNKRYPDGWVIVKVNGSEPHYRVFASWSGGYTNGDVWRMNSGIVKCEYDEEENEYSFYGHSGSVYVCNKPGYNRISAYNYGVLDSYIKRNAMTVLEEQDWEKLNYDTTL